MAVVSTRRIEAVGGVVGTVVFVGVERGEGCGVGDSEEFAGDGWGGGVEDGAGVFAEIVDAGVDGGGTKGLQASRGWGDLRGSAVRVQRAVNEEDVGHSAATR